jgi:hypothetical protein
LRSSSTQRMHSNRPPSSSRWAAVRSRNRSNDL